MELSWLNLKKIYQVEFEWSIASHRATPVIRWDLECSQPLESQQLQDLNNHGSYSDPLVSLYN